MQYICHRIKQKSVLVIAINEIMGLMVHQCWNPFMKSVDVKQDISEYCYASWIKRWFTFIISGFPGQHYDQWSFRESKKSAVRNQDTLNNSLGSLQYQHIFKYIYIGNITLARRTKRYY